MSELVDLATIAEAVGVNYHAVRNKWAACNDWPAHHDRAGLGGAKRWRVDDLPTAFTRRGKVVNVRLAVQRLQAARAANGAKELIAPGGEPIPAGLPSPADASPAATGAGGLAGGGVVQAKPEPTRPNQAKTAQNQHGAALEGRCATRDVAVATRDVAVATRDVAVADGAPDATLIGHLLAGAGARDDDFERVLAARDLYALLKPLLELPERHRGRRAMAEEIARTLGKSVAQVYRLAEVARERGGVLGLARMGKRRDRGQARKLISGPWLAWANAALAKWSGDDLPGLANRMRDAVRMAWVGGAPSERQCWLKATAKVARDLAELGAAREVCAELLNVPCPRRYVAAEAVNFRVAGRSLRDGKAIYDHNLTPVQRTAEHYRPGELVCGDITPLDIPVVRDDGSTAYARLIAWHDVATNWLWVDAVLLEKGEGIRREHVAASYARMCEQAPFGAPRRLYLDNGSEYQWDEMLVACKRLADFTGQQFAADEAASTVRERQVVRSIPFRPRAKRIEGLFGNLTDWLGWWFGYVGGNRITKKVATLGKGVQPARFDEVVDWLHRTLADYHATPQPRAQHMGGLSPQQKLEEALQADWKPWRIDRVTLALAFADYETRRVVRGTVSVGGVSYAGDCLMAMEGRVTVAVPRVLGEAGAYILDGGRIVGWVEPERVYDLTDTDGAKEAGRRRQALKLLLAERVKEAGGPLDEAQLAGTRAKLLGLDATLERADAAAQWVQPSAEVLALHEGIKAARERQIAEINRRMQVRQSAEHLNRLGVEDDEDTKLARAMGL